MGTSGRSRFEEFIIGSNTEKVVRFSNCPVLTVHQRWDSAKPIVDIVYATSLAESEKDFSKIVAQAQEIFGVKIHLVRINTPMPGIDLGCTIGESLFDINQVVPACRMA
jgi:hypothetical protein